MELRITRTFLDALARLAADDQKRVRETLSKVAQESGRSGLRLHPVGDFLSLSSGMDVRVLALPAGQGLTLVHVDHHNAAYSWGSRHAPVVDHGQVFAIADISTLASPLPDETRPTTTIHRFAGLPPAVASWLSSIGDEDQLIEAIGALAPELSEIALGAATAQLNADDTPSNVVLVTDDEALRQALRLPAEAWRVFLHPRQRHIVEMPNDRHVLVRGGPGTGKTVALVHRYARLRREATRMKTPPPAFVALTPANRLVIQSMLKQLGIEIDNDRLLVAEDLGRGQGALERSLRGYGAVLIDEGQDLPTQAIADLLALLESGSQLPPVMIAFDANQAIVNPTGDALSRLVGLADTVTLTYCYRSTKQVVDEARALLTRLETSYTGKDFKANHALSASRDAVASNFVAALSGPDVTRMEAPEGDAAAGVARTIDRLRRRYRVDQLAVIVAAPEQSVGTSALDPFVAVADGVQVLRPIDAKGREFRAGIVVDLVELGSAAAADGPIHVTQARYRSFSGLYVGLTRFRDEVSILVVRPGSNGRSG